jgi:hypothetical protein
MERLHLYMALLVQIWFWSGFVFDHQLLIMRKQDLGL